MPDEAGEGPPETPSEKKKGREKKVPKEEKREAEKAAEAMAKAAEKAELLAEKQEKLITTVDKLIDRGEDLGLVFENLSSAIKDGVIKDFKQLSSVMKRSIKGIEDREKKITESAEKVQASFGKTAEYSDRVIEAQRENAAAIKKHTEDLDKVYEGIREAAEAAVAGGIMGSPREKTPEYEDTDDARDNIEKWIETQLRPIEERDAPFSERWYLLWPIETTASSLRQPIEGESDEAKERRMEFYQKISQRVEDRRRLHDYQWLYKRASGVEAIINAASILPTGTTERVLREKGVVESMVKLQNLAEIVVEARRSQDKTRTEEGKRRSERLEDQMKKTMLRFMNGETEVDNKGREIGFIEAGVKEDQIEERVASNRLGGRLFIVLGFTASYDISDFAGGDFFVARLMHLKNRFKEQAKEGRPWFGRDKLWESFKPELFETKFGGGLLANKTPGMRGTLRGFHRRFGLERAEPEDVEEDIAGRKLRPLKITNPEQFRQLNLKEFGVMRENMLAADWADALLKADEARKLFLKPDQYLDRPNMEHFLGLRGDFEHLKGDVKRRLFSLMLGDLIEFHKGPGFGRRLFDRSLPLWERYTIKNPDTGEETEGISFVGSDSERLGLASAWASGEIHKKVDTALGHNMINKSYAEWLLRQKIDLFGIPGIGPVRATKEILDAIGWGGFLAAFLATIIEFFRQIGKDLEKGR